MYFSSYLFLATLGLMPQAISTTDDLFLKILCLLVFVWLILSAVHKNVSLKCFYYVSFILSYLILSSVKIHVLISFCYKIVVMPSIFQSLYFLVFHFLLNMNSNEWSINPTVVHTTHRFFVMVNVLSNSQKKC